MARWAWCGRAAQRGRTACTRWRLPSLFTRTYDQGLARGLAGAGADVTLIGRPLRRAESLDTRGYRFLPMFYRLAETGEDELGRARLALKGAEHVLGLARLRLGRAARQHRQLRHADQGGRAREGAAGGAGAAAQP